MGVITDREGNVIRKFPDTLRDWKQAAQVEASLRREFQEKLATAQAALKRADDDVRRDLGDGKITMAALIRPSTARAIRAALS